jgi:hypothetical protein
MFAGLCCLLYRYPLNLSHTQGAPRVVPESDDCRLRLCLSIALGRPAVSLLAGVGSVSMLRLLKFGHFEVHAVSLAAF